MFGVRSAQSRALVASLVLLLLLASVAILATWRAQAERTNRERQEHRAAVVTAMESASAEFLRGTTLLATAVFVEDAAPYINLYRQAQDKADSILEGARSQLVAIGDADEIAEFDSFLNQMGQSRQELDARAYLSAALDRPTRIEQGVQSYSQLQPGVAAMMANLSVFSGEQQAKMTSENAAAGRASNATLALLIGFSAVAFLGSAATLVVLIVSVVRPLASLRKSARAVASGDLGVRAEVAGPTEVQSLARDFNQMVEEIARAERAERESAEQVRAITHMAPNAIIMMDGGGLITFWNPAAERIFGYTPEEALGKELHQLLAPTSFHSKFGEGFAGFRESGRGPAIGQTLELSAFRRDKTEFPVELSLSAVEIGGAWHAIGIVKDITDRKAAEEALRESEARYRGIFESIQDIIYRTDAQGIIMEISPSVERVGYSREQLIGTQVMEVYADPEERAVLVKAIVERGEVSDFEIRLKTGDGRVINISVNGHVLRGPDGSFIGTEGVLRDISERKAAEYKIGEQKRFLGKIFESITHPLYVVDVKDYTIKMGNAASGISNLSKGLTCYALTHNRNSPCTGEHICPLKEVLRTKKSVVTEHIHYDKDGNRGYFEVHGEPIFDNEGNVIQMVESSINITERTQAEEALREQSRCDPLTGALNHGAIVGEMRSLIADGEQAAVWAVAMIDVNDLKVANDTYGHQVGDAVLVAVAVALSRDGALVGRYGGDEFVAILREADRTAAERYCSDVADALANSSVVDPETGSVVPVNASVGIAVFPEDATTLVDLIRVSDSAMYAAKRQRPDRRLSPRKRAPDERAA